MDLLRLDRLISGASARTGGGGVPRVARRAADEGRGWRVSVAHGHADLRRPRDHAALGELVDAVIWPLGTEFMDTSHSGPAVSGVVVTTSPVLRLAVAAYLARFKGQSRVHTESDLRGYLLWCESRQLDPLAATRPQIELYVRWLQEVRRYRPSTVSRRVSVVAEFYRTCVIDGVLELSPAEYVRRPNVPAESPTLGLTHLQFEALFTAART